MSAYTDHTSALERQLLLQLGARLKGLRKHKAQSAVALAQQVGISRTTLAAVEAGDPAPAIGTYIRVMSALGVSSDLALLATGSLQGATESPSKAPKRALPVVSAHVRSVGPHDAQDLQSLMLHKEAIRLMHQNPALIQQAMDTLERWRQAPNHHARFLWDEWSVILHRHAWRRALSTSRRGQELRQASPLPTILPPDARAKVLDQIRELKAGLVLGAPPAAGASET